MIDVGRGKTYSLAAAVLFVVALVSGSTAAARPGYVTFPGERTSKFSVQATQGYRITVQRTGHRVELVASNGSSAAIYAVHSPDSPEPGINARFPGLGLVSVHFHPDGPTRRTPAICGGRPSVSQGGTFQGVIRFRGEQDFTRVNATGASGSFFRSPKESCKGNAGNGSSSGPVYSLTVRTKVFGGWLAFSATKSPEGSPFAGSTSYFAVEQKHRHGMRSSRFAFASARSGAGFAMSGPVHRPESATLSPPDPFSGTASFHSGADSLAEWTGNLMVELPGVGTVKLAGPRFGSQLCFGRHCAGPLNTHGHQS